MRPRLRQLSGPDSPARRTALGYLVCALVVTHVTGCDRDEERSRAANLEEPARRVVSTMPSTTEMMYVIGAWDRLVGRSVFCDVPPQARELPSIGSGMEPDLERLLSLEPDLVIGTVAQNGYAFVNALEDAGVPVLLVPDRSLAELETGLVELGEAVGAQESAAAAAERLRVELERVRQAVVGRPRVSVLIAYDRAPIYAAGPDTLVNELVETAGGRNVVPAGDWVQLDREQVLSLAPEVILEPRLGTAGDPAAFWRPLATVPAVRHDRVHLLRSPAFYRPGPTADEAARELLHYLHPDVTLDEPTL